MKLDPGTPAQGRAFLLIIGVLILIMGINGLLSEPNYDPGRRFLGKILYTFFGPYGDDYGAVIFGTWSIYYGLFRYKKIKKNIGKYQNTNKEH